MNNFEIFVESKRMDDLTILVDPETNIIHYVFISEDEKDDFCEHNPDWLINGYNWIGNLKEKDLKEYTFHDKDLVKMVKEVFPKFKTIITRTEYFSMVEKLPYELSRKYFPSIREIDEYSHYINTKDIINWNVNDDFDRIARLPLIFYKNGGYKNGYNR